MSSLRSAIDEVRLHDEARLSDAELDADFADLERASRALESAQLRLLAEIHRRECWRRDGHLSTSQWLAARFRLPWSEAARRVGQARALEEMPSTREALGEGEVSSSAMKVLVAARDAHPSEFSDHEDTLLEAARTLSARELRRALAYWRQALDGPRALDEAKRRWELRRLHVSPSLGGMVRVDGDLDPETGQTVIAALGAVMDAEGHRPIAEDPRSYPQRRADAAGEICRRFLDSADRPQVAGDRLTSRSPWPSTRFAGRRAAGASSTTSVRCTRRSSGGGPATRPSLTSSPGDAPSPSTSDERRPSCRPPSGAPVSTRRRVPVPRLRPSAPLVGRAPRGSLGRRRRDGALEPRAALPATSPARARAGRVPR